MSNKNAIANALAISLREAVSNVERVTDMGTRAAPDLYRWLVGARAALSAYDAAHESAAAAIGEDVG